MVNYVSRLIQILLLETFSIGKRNRTQLSVWKGYLSTYATYIHHLAFLIWYSRGFSLEWVYQLRNGISRSNPSKLVSTTKEIVWSCTIVFITLEMFNVIAVWCQYNAAFHNEVGISLVWLRFTVFTYLLCVIHHTVKLGFSGWYQKGILPQIVWRGKLLNCWTQDFENS